MGIIDQAVAHLVLLIIDNQALEPRLVLVELQIFLQPLASCMSAQPFMTRQGVAWQQNSPVTNDS